jgi:Tol biopolymer transport system component
MFMRAYVYRILAVSFMLALTVSSVQAGGFSADVGGLSWSPDSKSLLYSVYDDGLYIIAPNGDGEPLRIADADIFDWSPQWSPDGKSIISTIEVDNQAGIFRTPIKGDESQRLTEDVGWRPGYYAPNGMQPRYSPDGKTIAFLSLREGDIDTSLYSMTADGDDEHILTDAGAVYEFAWSPDSQAIAFTATPEGEQSAADLFLIDAFGTKLRRLTTTADVDSYYQPAWTPDGKAILFTVVTDDNNGRIDIIDSDAQNRKVFREQASEPIYSPDRTHILFTSPAEHWFNLSIMNADSTESDDITISLPGERAYYSAAWSPDGSQIAFVSFLFDAPKSESITLVNADGTNPQTLLTFPIS